MVTTSQPPGGRAGPFEDNKPIHVVSVELSHPYAADENSYGRCRWMKVHATTDDGVRFLLYDDTEGVSNARQYGSADDPRGWGSGLRGYSKCPQCGSFQDVYLKHGWTWQEQREAAAVAAFEQACLGRNGR